MATQPLHLASGCRDMQSIPWQPKFWFPALRCSSLTTFKILLHNEHTMYYDTCMCLGLAFRFTASAKLYNCTVH